MVKPSMVRSNISSKEVLHKTDFMKGVRGQDAVEDLRVIEAAYKSSKLGSMTQIN